MKMTNNRNYNKYHDNVTRRRANRNDYEEVTKMTNNRYNRERYTDNRYNDGFEERHIARRSDRAREITRAKGRKQNVVIATLAIALVAVIAASFIVFGALNKNVKSSDTSPTSISVKADKNENKAAAQSPTQAAQQTAQPAAQQTSQDDNQQTTQTNDQQNSSRQNNNSQDNTQTDDNIKNIDGERVYVDTKRQAPDKTGTPLHYYANGKTSYGFDWTYDTDNANFAIRCDYNFDQQQYDFIIYGVTPGISHVTLYYNTSDNVQVPVNLTINVDNDLNVTQG